jgi:tellurite resistance protein TerB
VRDRPGTEEKEGIDPMSDFARSVGPRLTRKIVRLRDETLLEGAMAAGALVALADQKLSVEESLMLQTMLANAELLQIYDPELALSLYTRHVDRIRGDFSAGKQTALEAIGRCASDIEAAELIVQVGIAIAKADRIFHEDELRVIEEICQEVGIEGLDTLGLADATPTRMN